MAMMRKLDLARLLGRHEPTKARERDLALALIASRVLAPGSKLATVRALAPETASTSLAGCWSWARWRKRIYAALDWLGDQQARVEQPWRIGAYRTARWCSTT